jgi:hypothetical protein
MKDKNKFEQQEAPIKNTDNAFVKVGKDGAPVVPNVEKENNDRQSEDRAQRPTHDRER